jgi:glycerate kinase
VGEQYQEIYDLGIDAIAVIPPGPVSLEYAMEHAAALATTATERALRLIHLGSLLAVEW